MCNFPLELLLSSPTKGLAKEIGLSIKSRASEIVGMTRSVAPLTLQLSWWSHDKVFTQGLGSWGLKVRTCITLQLRRWAVKQATPTYDFCPAHAGDSSLPDATRNQNYPAHARDSSTNHCDSLLTTLQVTCDLLPWSGSVRDPKGRGRILLRHHWPYLFSRNMSLPLEQLNLSS